MMRDRNLLAAGLVILLVLPAALGVFLLSGLIVMRLGAPEPWFAIACFVGVSLWAVALWVWCEALRRYLAERVADAREGYER